MTSETKQTLLGFGLLLLLFNFFVLPYFKSTSLSIEQQKSWDILITEDIPKFLFTKDAFVLVDGASITKYDLVSGKKIDSTIIAAETKELVQPIIMQGALYYFGSNYNLAKNKLTIIKINLKTLKKEWTLNYPPDHYRQPTIDKSNGLLLLNYGELQGDNIGSRDYYEFIDDKSGQRVNALFQKSDQIVTESLDSILRKEAITWDPSIAYYFKLSNLFYDRLNNQLYHCYNSTPPSLHDKQIYTYNPQQFYPQEVLQTAFKIIDSTTLYIMIPNEKDARLLDKKILRKSKTGDISTQSNVFFPLSHPALNDAVQIDHYRFFEHDKWTLAASSQKRSSVVTNGKKKFIGSTIHTFLKDSSSMKSLHLETEIALQPKPCLTKDYFVGTFVLDKISSQYQVKILELGTWNSQVAHLPKHMIVKNLHADQQNVYILTVTPLYRYQLFALPLNFAAQ